MSEALKSVAQKKEEQQNGGGLKKGGKDLVKLGMSRKSGRNNSARETAVQKERGTSVP